MWVSRVWHVLKYYFFLRLSYFHSFSVSRISSEYFWASLRHFYRMIHRSLYRAYLLSTIEIAFPSPMFHKLNEKSWSRWYFPRLRKRTLQELRRKKLSCGATKADGLRTLWISTSKALGNVPFENLVTWISSKSCLRQGLLRYRLIWWIIFVQKYDLILDKALRNVSFRCKILGIFVIVIIFYLLCHSFAKHYRDALINKNRAKYKLLLLWNKKELFQSKCTHRVLL